MLQVHLPVRVPHAAGQHARADRRRRHDAVRVSAQPLETEATRAEPEPVARASGSQQYVDESLRRDPVADLRQPAQHRQRVGRDPDLARDQVDDLPLLARFAARLDHRLGVLNERRRVEAEERDRQVVALQPRRAGQDVVGVAVGLVDVEVERDEQVEVAERRLERLAVRAAQHRVAGAGEEGTDLLRALGRHLFCEQRRGQRAEHVREASDARARLAVRREPCALGDLVQRDRRKTEHGAARPVEVPACGVEKVEQERDERAESPEARAGPPVHGGAVGGGQIACEAPDDSRPGLRSALPSARAGTRAPSRARPPSRRSAARARSHRQVALRRARRAATAAARRRCRGAPRRARNGARSRCAADRRRRRARLGRRSRGTGS